MQIWGTEFTPFILSLAKLISIKILHSIHDSIASICAYCYDVPGSWMLSSQIYSNFTISFTFMRNQVLEHAIFSPQEHAKNVLIFERWKSKRNLREKDAELEKIVRRNERFERKFTRRISEKWTMSWCTFSFLCALSLGFDSLSLSDFPLSNARIVLQIALSTCTSPSKSINDIFSDKFIILSFEPQKVVLPFENSTYAHILPNYWPSHFRNAFLINANQK